MSSICPRSLSIFLFVVFVASIVPFSGRAQSLPEAPAAASADDPWNAAALSADPKTLYAAASAVPVPDGANIVELSEDEHFTFDGAGRMVHEGHYIYKVITQKGAEEWDSFSVGWEPWLESRPVIRARVIAPDFTVHVLDPATINEAPARGGDYKIYSDDKRLRAPLPAIAPGVVVEEDYSIAETEPLFTAGRVGRVVLGQEDVPVAHCRVVFDYPAALPLRTNLLLLPGLNPLRTETAGRVTLSFVAGPFGAIDANEPFAPPEVIRFPAVEFSTATSWQAVAADYSRIVDSRSSSPAVKAAVAPLIAHKRSVAEKEAAIVDFLDREVRYTGIEFGEAAIVPHDPAETLAKKYGDCKDKATLLVAMLRAAGIPAYVALLNAESHMDVPADLPGMGMFDHAIVYVPGKNSISHLAENSGSAGAAGLWIDATDRYAPLGQLPLGDQDRLALIASDATTALVKIPEAPSRENGLAETRELTLADNGPASIVEVTQPKGIFDSAFRALYADKPDSETRDGLRGYMQSEYVCDDLTRVERTDPADLSQPFRLTIACDKAKRAYTALESAQAAIRVDRLFQFLPDELKQKDDTDQKKASDSDKPQKPRTDDWWLPVAFADEWNYRIVPPAGFIPRTLPRDATISLGPAVLTEEFTADKDGVVHARLAFDTVKRRYTVAEAAALRNEVADLVNGPPILVDFEPRGATLLREGKVKDALASYRALVALNPNAAVHHLQVANVLLQAGMGEAARNEAQLAVKLDPKSALAERVLADILKHDLVGRDLRPGSDMVGAAEAYRAAIKLDPDDHTAQADLAILLEYDSVGRRYGSHAHMKEAIAEYQSLGQDKLAELGLTNNLAFALFYGGDYADAYKAAHDLNPEPKALMAASIAMLQGSAAGLDEANKHAEDGNSFKETARTAGQMLMNVRQYQQAADFFQAGAGGDDAARTLGLANLLRGAQHHEDVKFANTPADAARRFAMLPFDPELTRDGLASMLSRNALNVLNAMNADALKTILESGQKTNTQLARQGSSLNVTEDIVLHSLDPRGEGDDSTGYREKLQAFGGRTLTLYIVKESGQYKLLDSEENPDAIGLEILDRIQTGDLRGAKVLLDWMREDAHLAGGDDPFGGPVFPRFWIRGEAPDARKMKLAAASILAGSKPTVAQGVGILEQGLKDASSDRERANLRIALALGYQLQDNFAGLLDVSAALLKDEPESPAAFIDNVVALLGLNRFDDALALADQRLKLLDHDSDAYEMKAQIEANRGDFAAALGWLQKLADMGKADAMLLNEQAWYALFTGNVQQADIAKAIRATEMRKDTPEILHTLACLYAEVGNTKDAREVLIRAMDDWNLNEPNEDVWYVLGRIAEQYGERDIAVADYRRLQKPKEPLTVPTSTWKLAQIRLKAMGVS